MVLRGGSQLEMIQRHHFNLDNDWIRLVVRGKKNQSTASEKVEYRRRRRSTEQSATIAHRFLSSLRTLNLKANAKLGKYVGHLSIRR